MQPYQYLLDLQEREAPSLSNFVVGKNEELVRILQGVKQGKGPKFVYIFGPQGAGITHLLKSLVPEQSLWVPHFDSACTLYTVDDVEQLDLGWSLQLRNLQNTIRNTPGCSLVCGGKVPLNQLPLSQDITSRLGWGLTYQVHPLDDEMRQQAITQHAWARGIVLTEDTLKWMNTHLPRDMRTLMCVLNAADKLSLEKQRRVTVPLLKEVCQALKPAST